MYSEKLMEHFTNPRNVGEIRNPDGVGLVGDPDCGDYVKVFIRVEDNVLADVRFLCKGCPAAIALASAATELARGKNLDEAMEITDEDVLNDVGDVPEAKTHCSMLAVDALHDAITDHVMRFIGLIPYRGRKALKTEIDE